MVAGTEMEVRKQSFDLTRAPAEQWNAAMLDVVIRNVFRGQEITTPQLHYCLTIAESIGLNPMIGEVYFIPSKSKDGKGPAWMAYVGRNGLVTKAAEHGCYYEAETVHANDKFRVMRRANGERTVTHSYDQADRGDIVGAYAFLHRIAGDRIPAFFYAKMDEYKPTFDAQWKADASPWGNQTSAMIEKCAMIGAGRKWLDLGNVLADGEIARVQQMQEAGPQPITPQASVGHFDPATVTDDVDLAERLRGAIAAANLREDLAWTDAKCDMVFSGRSHDELVALVERLEVDNAQVAAEPEPVDAEVVHEDTPAAEPAHEPGVEQPAGASGPVISPAAAEARLARLEATDLTQLSEDEASMAEEEMAFLREQLAKADPDQPSLLG